MASPAEPSSPSGVTGKWPGHQVLFFSYVVYKGPEVLFAVVVHGLALPGLAGRGASMYSWLVVSGVA